tara:strand:- start:104 stop:529 length:426 start_codon:yes stop_codon:yes gene_type:complete
MEAMTKEFKDYQKDIKVNASEMCTTFQDRGFLTVSPKTENHLVLLDLTNKDITGKDAEDLLGSLNITVNKNSIPNDPQSPFVTSGIRIGTPAITTRGFQKKEAKLVANLICDAIEGKNQLKELSKITNQVNQICENFPVYR